MKCPLKKCLPNCKRFLQRIKRDGEPQSPWIMKRRPMGMDMPWTTLAQADSNREYFALLSYLPLKKYRAIPSFFRFTFQIQKQLRKTPGIIGYSLRAKPLSRNFWTLSAWTDERMLMEFVTRIPHAQAMKGLMPHMEPTKFTKWRVSGSALPLRWDDAMRRAQQEE